MANIIQIVIQITICSFTHGIFTGMNDNPKDSPLTILQANAMGSLNEAVSTKTSHKTRHGHGGRRKSCCENGGLCILGSFCQCPAEYHGRYCEKLVHDKDCDFIPHGAWIRSDCDLCHCYQGEFSCLQRIFPGCDESQPLDLKKKIDPLQRKDIEILSTNGHIEGLSVDSEEYDYSDQYDDIITNTGVKSKSLTVLLSLAVILTVNLAR